MNIKRKLKKELHAISIPSLDRVLPLKNTGMSCKKAPQKVRRPLGVMLSTAILALALIVGVAAIPKISKYLNARQVTDLPYGLEEVPDGFVGIYNLDDLALLCDPTHNKTNFILMCDIDIPDTAYEPNGRYESGFSPLGNYAGGFCGSFNGNGHVIRNLKIFATEAANTETSLGSAVGLFGFTSAKITYLGVENAEITVTGSPTATNVHIGTLAAKAGIVGGCYAENVVIRYDAVSSMAETTAIGGLVGYAEYLDSCYVKNAQLTVNDSGTGQTMLCGGIAGTAHSAVTSYFAGSLDVSANRYTICKTDPVAAMLYPAYTPILLTENAMEMIQERLQPTLDPFYYNLLLSYYVRQDLDATGGDAARKEQLEAYFEHLAENGAAIYTEDMSEVRVWYQLTGDVSLDELDKLSQMMAEAFGSADAFENFCTANGIKCGKLFCYSFDETENILADDLNAFDFENIWYESGNGIALRAFKK